MILEDLKEKAKSAFLAGVKAADPELALQRAFEEQPLPVLTNGTYVIIAVGKAACKMAQSALNALPEGAKSRAIAVTNYENVTDIEGCRVFGAAHPVPDAKGLEAADEVIALLKQATKDDLVLALVSGGSSALLPSPVDGLNLRDKSNVNEVLLTSGFDIYQMNLVRQSLSKLKGGGFLRYAAPAKVQSYILSDVLGDDLRVVGSGPSIGPIGTVADARRLLIETGNFTKMPEPVRSYLENTFSTPTPVHADHATLIGSNTQSLAAMAANAGATVMEAPLVGDVNAAAQRVLNDVRDRLGKGPFALAYGGETTVELTGNGQGGRNQELALLVAHKARQAQLNGTWCFLSGGTDGRDGPTDAAGGIVDGETLERIQARGGLAVDFLDNNDSYTALKMSGDLLMTGATGTNVADLQLFLMA
jgi:hydroxypyruvate reductase